MPHHTVGSWSTGILGSNKNKGIVEDMRKKAFIELRNAAASAHTSIGDGVRPVAYDAGPRARVPLPRKKAVATKSLSDDLEHDLNAVTQFLAEGGANEIEDGEVWDVLQSKVFLFCL